MSNNETKDWKVLVLDFLKFLFGGMSQWIKNMFVFLLLLLFFASLMMDKILNFIFKPPTQAQIDAMVKEKLRIDSTYESAKLSMDSAKAAKAFNFYRILAVDSYAIKESMPNCVGVNYYGVHNGGKTIIPNGDWVIESYSSTEKIFINTFRKIDRNDPAKEEIWEGLIWLNNQALNQKTALYIEDVSKYSELNIGQTKSYFLDRGVKSTIVMLVKNIGSEFFFVSFDFDIVNPLEKNPTLFLKIREYQQMIKNNL